MSHEAKLEIVRNPDDSGSSRPTHAQDGDGSATTSVIYLPIDQIRRGPVIRVMGEDHTHARLLAGTPAQLPPILVERSTMSVIDGMHRLLAARIRGDKTIAVRYFEGSEAEAFVTAVRANIEHGRPLSLADREHAAERIIVLRPEWSDRAISETCGLSPKTIAGIRRRTTAGLPQLAVRTGRDGRVRPIDPVAGRHRIANAIAAEPAASLRQIAERTATSVATVRDVRRRLARGLSPLPDRLQARVDKADGTRRDGPDDSPEGTSCPAPHPSAHPAAEEASVLIDLTQPVEADTDIVRPATWASDAAFASTARTRQFVRWFDQLQVELDDWEHYVDAPPLSRLYEVVTEAKARAKAWEQFAEALELRARRQGSLRTP